MGDPSIPPEPVTIEGVVVSGRDALALPVWSDAGTGPGFATVLAFVAGLCAAWGFGLDGVTAIGLALLAVGVFGLSALRRRARSRAAAAAWDASRYGGQTLTWRLSADGVEQTGPHLKRFVPWSGFLDVDLTAQGYVFTLAMTAALLLPATGLTDSQKAAVNAWVIWARRDGGVLDDQP